MTLPHKKLSLPRRTFWAAVAVLTALRLFVTGFQQAYTWVGAPRWMMS